ncbi:MAG TPA: hypothetical protein VMT46_11455 [Anaerolineaceae bacterium]|nr:hypothetical protein [Anaerolineaceae bacterium]
MDDQTRIHLANITVADRGLQNQAFSALLAASEQPVDWAYAAWDDLRADLADPDNHVRAIAAQILCNLARSDPEGRMLKDFPALLAVTHDERFVTARHCLQALWKIGLAGDRQREMVVAGLAGRFAGCAAEKNCTLIRYDIIVDLKNLYYQTGDEAIRQKALELIETEPDLKYRKKYAGVCKSRKGNA